MTAAAAPGAWPARAVADERHFARTYAEARAKFPAAAAAPGAGVQSHCHPRRGLRSGRRQGFAAADELLAEIAAVVGADELRAAHPPPSTDTEGEPP